MKRRMLSVLVAIGLPALGAGLFLSTSCNEHVFEVIDPCVNATDVTNLELDPLSKADILIVVDNSGSMCEEQDNLIANFYNPACPIDVNNVQEEYKNPSESLIQSELQQCGFIQILAAYENEFRVGVITTDIGQCDNRFNLAASSGCGGQTFNDWGRRPQRGCLQAPPDATKKFIENGDADIAETFRDTLLNIRTYGSSFERGLDAVEVFLSENSSRAPGCEDDLDDFIREEAALVVIFLTDEDDCSHQVSGQFPDETAGESCENAGETPPQVQDPPIQYDWCYNRRDELTPVSRYSNFLKNYKGPGRESSVRVAVIAGALFEDDGDDYPAGCRVANDGSAAGMCKDPWGQSNILSGPSRCNPDNLDPGEVCCEADPGTRYFQLADSLGDNLGYTDSICQVSFQDTMRQIASFAAQIDSVELNSPPQNTAQIAVGIIRAGDTAETRIDRIPDGAATDGEDGWQFDPPQTIRFYGDALPQPGDEVKVFVGVQSEGEDNCGASAASDDEET